MEPINEASAEATSIAQPDYSKTYENSKDNTSYHDIKSSRLTRNKIGITSSRSLNGFKK